MCTGKGDSPAAHDSAFDVASRGDLEKAVPITKTDSAADLGADTTNDPVKKIIYQVRNTGGLGL